MPDPSRPSTQDEIEGLLDQARGAAGMAPAETKDADAPEQRRAATADAAPAGGAQAVLEKSPPTARQADRSILPDAAVSAGDLELLLQQAEQALASIHSPNAPQTPGLSEFKLDDFAGAPPNAESATLDLIRDVELDLKIEFGRTHMCLEDVLKLRRGSVVPLDKLAGDPVDIFVNGRLIARGEVLVLNDNFCVRVAELIAGEKIGL